MKEDKRIVNQIVDGIVSFLKKNNREHLLNKVVEELRQREVDKKVVIVTPVEFKENEKKRAIALVEKIATKNTKNTEFTVDENLIDGLKIIYRDRLWDFSVESQLKRIIRG